MFDNNSLDIQVIM